MSILKFRFAVQQFKLLPAVWNGMRDNYNTAVRGLIQEGLIVEARPTPATWLRISHTTTSQT